MGPTCLNDCLLMTAYPLSIKKFKNKPLLIMVWSWSAFAHCLLSCFRPATFLIKNDLGILLTDPTRQHKWTSCQVPLRLSSSNWKSSRHWSAAQIYKALNTGKQCCATESSDAQLFAFNLWLSITSAWAFDVVEICGFIDDDVYLYFNLFVEITANSIGICLLLSGYGAAVARSER